MNWLAILFITVALLCAATVINGTSRVGWKKKRVPCASTGSTVFQCAMVKEANEASMHVYVSEGRGGMTPLEKRGPLGHKFKKPLFKKICKKEDKKQVYYYSCEGQCGTCCLEHAALDEDRPIWATWGHWANGKAKCMGKSRPQRPRKPPSETLKDIDRFYDVWNTYAKGGYKCHPTNVGPNQKSKYDKEDVIMNIKTPGNKMKSWQCYQKCIELAQKIEREEDPQGADICCQFHSHQSKTIDTKKVVKNFNSCKLFKYDSFQASVSSREAIKQEKENGVYVIAENYYHARSVSKGYPRENLKYLLEKPTRWQYLPNYQKKFF